MYKIGRSGDRIVIMDWNGKSVYSVEADSIVLYRNDAGAVTTAKAADLPDDQLLRALANAVKLAI